MDAFHLTTLAFALASAAIYGLVARTVQRRPVSDEVRGARNAFVLWWGSLAVLSAVAAVLALPFVPLDLALWEGLTIVLLGLICVALAGLVYYLVFIYTNQRKALLPIILGYAAVFLFLLYFIFKQVPNGVVDARWGPKMTYQNEVTTGPLVWALVILIIVPPILAAAAYLRLYGKVDDPLQKRRVLLVGLGILLWFLTSLGASVGNVQLADWWQVASRLISLTAAGMTYYAFALLKPAPPKATPAPGKPSPYLAGDPMDPRRRVAIARIAPAA